MKDDEALVAAARRIADAITPNLTPVRGAYDAYVGSLTEAVMDVSAAGKDIADALREVAEAIRERP